ncbi:MAG: aminotransferase class V-fold PLP-dependent enzyme, partial [Lutibacter sp.]|nr:aminotransferase class V-fold PLP-dependent enzyme [Lutibacter sp.]
TDGTSIKNLKSYLIENLKTNFPTIQFNGLTSEDKASSHILNVRFDTEYPMLLFNLDLKGIAVSGGSACQSGSSKGSHVLNTILNENDAKNTSLRISFSKLNTLEELDYFIEVLKMYVK